ncbi:hypothetical protein ACFQ07_07810, partial [Actinomadura adrarensis]
MLKARLIEAIDVIESGTQPFLLAVSTLATGALDAGTLVERVAELEGLGIAPARSTPRRRCYASAPQRT